MLDHFARTLVIAPHPDDEVLGCGGTIARLTSLGREVHVAIATTGRPPRFSEALLNQVRAEAEAAHGLLGVTATHLLDLPTAELDRVAHADVNQAIGGLIEDLRPQLLLIPFLGDVHRDHQLLFRSALVAARPRGGLGPSLVAAYETLSETNWGAPGVTPAFIPNLFVDIGAWLDTKIAAFARYASQVKEPPDERSIEALRALALLRGATVHRKAAEAFVQIRAVA